MIRRLACALAVAPLLAGVPLSANATTGCQLFNVCETDTEAAIVGLLSREEVLALPKFPGDDGGAVVDRADDEPVYEYVSLNDCAQVRPDSPTKDASCAHALRDCPPEELGPLLRIWRRTVATGEVIEGWRTRGLTCASDVAPGARPTLTMADIKAQFMRTPWAKPQVSSQPAGNVTLVNLMTFYQVEWSSTGFAPGEVDRSVLRGIPVRIRPKLVGFTYVFGDGTSYGPTTSTGGVYPDGDVTHVYARKGQFPVRVETSFGADFSLDGTTWDPIPSTATVPGPTTTITVREAKASLSTTERLILPQLMWGHSSSASRRAQGGYDPPRSLPTSDPGHPARNRVDSGGRRHNNCVEGGQSGAVRLSGPTGETDRGRRWLCMIIAQQVSASA